MYKIPRILTFCLSLALLPCLAGCQNTANTELTPFELYRQAYQKLQTQDGIEYTVDAYLDMNGTALEAALDNSLDAVSLMFNGDVKQVRNDDASYDMSADMDIKVPFTDIGASMQIYQTDGYLYLNLPDFAIAYKMPLDTAAENTPMSTWGANQITEDMLTDSSVNNAGDTIHLTLDGSKLNEQVAVYTAATGDVPPVSITVEDIPITVKLDDSGSITSYTTQVDMQVSQGDTSLDIILDANVDITATDNITIAFPTDLDSYTELNTEDLLAAQPI